MTTCLDGGVPRPADRRRTRPGRAVVVITALTLTLAGCTVPGTGGASAAPSAAAAPARLTVPDVVGRTAAVAENTLRREGFTDVSLGTVDGRPLVIIPQNWTVRSQSARPGSTLAPAAVIVLGCARNGHPHVLQLAVTGH